MIQRWFVVTQRTAALHVRAIFRGWQLPSSRTGRISVLRPVAAHFNILWWCVGVSPTGQLEETVGALRIVRIVMTAGGAGFLVHNDRTGGNGFAV
jgi:hypothetical protein